MDNRLSHCHAQYWLMAILCLSLGCQRGFTIVPVKGVVRYHGKPLAFGSVKFQPVNGLAARGDIQADGSFRLTTFEPDDGAVVGNHQVRITCYASEEGRSGGPSDEHTSGKSLIPDRYLSFRTSGLTARVTRSGDNFFEFNLSDADE